MVSQSYVLEKPPPPSAAKVFFDQRVMPVAIDAAGAVEARVERLAGHARRQPIVAVSVAIGVGVLLSMLMGRARGSGR